MSAIRPKMQMLTVPATDGSGWNYVPTANRPSCAWRPFIARINAKSNAQCESWLPDRIPGYCPGEGENAAPLLTLWATAARKTASGNTDEQQHCRGRLGYVVTDFDYRPVVCILFAVVSEIGRKG
jgi:hypothetical protein